MEILRTPPPPPRGYTRRLTDAIKALRPGDSFKTDRDTAECAAAYFRRAGLGTRVRQQDDGTVQVWVVERE